MCRVDEDALNMSVRKFLKKLGVTSQREIESSVRELVSEGRLRGDETLAVTATVTVDGLDSPITVDGTVSLS
jgi:16S rRNA U516 pseudouridylate synthase RsuA-like enzyme